MHGINPCEEQSRYLHDFTLRRAETEAFQKAKILRARNKIQYEWLFILLF